MNRYGIKRPLWLFVKLPNYEDLMTDTLLAASWAGPWQSIEGGNLGLTGRGQLSNGCWVYTFKDNRLVHHLWHEGCVPR